MSRSKRRVKDGYCLVGGSPASRTDAIGSGRV